VDLDVGLRNLDIALGMAEEGVLPFTCLLDGTYATDQLTSHPAWPGLYLLTAPVNAEADDMDHAAFAQFLSEAKDRYDHILLDAPAGVGTMFRMAVQSADQVILVTGGDKATLRDAARAAQLLDGAPARLLVNRLQTRLFARMKTTVDDIMDEVSLPLLGLVPEDRTVPLCAMGGKALRTSPRSPAAKAADRVTRRLLGEKVPLGRI
jgi:septum site-determining protein MinD